MLEYLHDAFRKDRGIVLEAVKNGFPLMDVMDAFKTDRDIVLEAVKNGFPLWDVMDPFKADRDIVLEAAKQNHNSLQYADSAFFLDPVVLASNPQFERQ